MPLEKRTTEEQEIGAGRTADLETAELIDLHVGADVDHRGATGDQRRAEIRKELRERALAPLQQDMKVLALRDAFAVLGAVGEAVPLDQRDPGEVAGGPPGGGAAGPGAPPPRPAAARPRPRRP